MSAEAIAASANSDKSNQALEELLRKWFSAQFVRSAKLSILRAVHSTGSYPAFAQLLAEASDADRATILSKLDKHAANVQMRSKTDILKHVEDLAAGHREPATKVKQPKKKNTEKKTVGIISRSKY